MSSERNFSSVLIIGADGQIGSMLFQRWSETSTDVYATTRRNIPDGRKRIIRHVDLALPLSNSLNRIAPEIVFICAGVTSFSACEADPLATEKINVYAARDIAENFLQKGSFVIFLSTSAVFDGFTWFPNEDSTPTYTTEYGRQKALAESLLSELDPDRKSIAIVRLTKVLSKKNPVVLDILSNLKQHTVCKPFSDLVIAPISGGYVLNALTQIAVLKKGGIFHLSGTQDVTYAELARVIAHNVNEPTEMVQPVLSTDIGIKLMYKPKFAALGMRRTVEIAGIQAQDLGGVMRDLCLFEG